MTRGPDFLPYPLPAAPQPAPMAPTEVLDNPRSRWDVALAGLTPAGVAAVTAGLVALIALLLVSLLTGHRGTGAVLAVAAALVAVLAGAQALKQELPADSVSLVKGGQVTGVVSGVLALLLLLLIRPADAQPPVRVPQPVPTPSASQPQQAPSPTPAPSATPRTDVLPPGTLPGFGIPTQPEAPLTDASTDKGTLTGLVVDSAGKPVPNATILVERATPGDTSDAPGCPVQTTARTDAKGAYALELCQLGDGLGYKVTISASGAVASTELFVNSGRTTRYDVILAIRTS